MLPSRPVIHGDLAKLDATTDKDIVRQIAEDPDTAPELTNEFSTRRKSAMGIGLSDPDGRPSILRESPCRCTSIRM